MASSRKAYDAMTYAQKRRADRREAERERARLGMTRAEYRAHRDRELAALLERVKKNGADS